MQILLICTLWLSVSTCFGLGNLNPAVPLEKINGAPLLISSIENGRTKEAESEVTLHAWFFPAKTNFEKAPVVLWMKESKVSAPEDSFQEKNTVEKIRSGSFWTHNCSLIYINTFLSAQDQTTTVKQLYVLSITVFKKFPALRNNNFFIVGNTENGGKYVPLLGAVIYEKNRHAKIKINLEGLAIGSGWVDPINQLVYSEYLYQIGLVDFLGAQVLQNNEKTLKILLRSNKYEEAAQWYDREILKTIRSLTGLDDLFNYVLSVGTADASARNVSLFGRANSETMRSVAPLVAKLLERTKIMFFNGQLDVVVPYPSTENFLNRLQFNAAGEYKNAKRQIWYVDEEVAGFVKSAGNLMEVLVRNAGHVVVNDQPRWFYRLMNHFIFNLPFV